MSAFHPFQTLAASGPTTPFISACILEDWNTDGQIVGALNAIGMNPVHVRIIIKDGSGTDPARHFWRRGEEGRYGLLEEMRNRAA